MSEASVMFLVFVFGAAVATWTTAFCMDRRQLKKDGHTEKSRREMSPLAAFADRELRLLGYSPDADVFGQCMYDDVMELVRVFADQGHSGGSFSVALGIFDKLAKYQPLTPLTGAADEWMDVGDGTEQNVRSPRVFRKNGVATDIDGKVFCLPNGHRYMTRESATVVTFPYMPKTQYVDVPYLHDQL